MSVTVVYTFTAKKGQESKFAEILIGESKQLEKLLPGCSDMKVYRQDNEPSKIITIETWDSREAQEACIKSMKESGAMKEPMKLLENMPEWIFLNPA